MTQINTTAAGPSVQVEMSYNANLPTGEKKACVAFYVTPVGFDGARAAAPDMFMAAAVDVSTSMGGVVDPKKPREGSRIEQAKVGALAFLDSLRAQDYFALYIFGAQRVRIFPTKGDPVKASPANIAAAKDVVLRLSARDNDTQVAGALRLFSEDVQAMRGKGVSQSYLALLTDGDYSDAPVVRQQIELFSRMRKEGAVATIISFGISTEWNVEKLRLISDGTISPPPQVLTDAAMVKAAFQEVAEQGAAAQLSNVRMMIKKAASVPLEACSVQMPISNDLLGAASKVDETVTTINLGSWDNEKRLFYVELGVEQPTSSANLMAAVIWFEYDFNGRTEKTKPEPVRVTWTADSGLSSVIARGVNRAQGIEGSKVRIRKAAQEAAGGNFDSAERILGEQYKLAFEADDKDLMAMLAEHVDVIDGANGKVRLKNRDAAAVMKLDAGSSVVRRRKPATAQ